MEFIQNKLNHAKSVLTVTKAKSLPHGQFEAILSTDDLDRHGEHVDQKGLTIPKNQVIKMYYNHETNGASLPIGKWLEVKKKDGKLVGLGEIDLEDDFALKVYKKVLKGYIDSISIGFYPQEYDGETATWTKSTLVEASLVAEPANVAAVVTQKQLGFTEAEFKKALKVKLAEVKLDEDDVTPGTPPEEVVKDPATYGLDAPEQSEPAINSESEEATSEDGASDTELKTAFETLKSKVDALEAAVKATDEGSATTKQLIKVRLAGKQVDKTANELNAVLRIKLKGTN